MSDFTKKHTLITGTLLLTCTGFLTRILGFFYRIFLSRTIGAEGLGLYNMVHPIFGICFALCAGSIQTALSQFVAAHTGKGKAIFRIGLSISFVISILLAALIWHHADFIAAYILMEPRCAPLLPIMAVSVPCSAIHACINGYYYGIQKAKVPAFAQVVEQMIRIGAVFLLADIYLETGREITVQLAVYGHLIGEIASSLFTVVCFQFFAPSEGNGARSKFIRDFKALAGPLMVLALPLMGNRLVLNVLQSMEAIWIPNSLGQFGLTSSEAFSVYGVLTGMALPFILFPSTISNSLAVLLLPTVAAAQSDGNERRIQSTISVSLRYSLYMGILCIGIFILFGDDLGLSVFHDNQAGSFIITLAWLCPFLYLATTMGSILNGLGKTSTTFIQSALALIMRILFVLIGIPRYGITAYLWGMLASELFLALMHLFSLKRMIPFTWNAWEMIVKPSVFLFLSIGIYYAVSSVYDPMLCLPLFLKTAVHIGVLCTCYGGFLILNHQARKR